MSLIQELLALMPDTVAVERGTRDGRGKFVPSGETLNVRARVVGQHRIVRMMSGQEQVSTVNAIIAGSYGLSVEYRYTLPEGFEPRQPAALAVSRIPDESGVHHEKVWFA